jgi:uncharacterized protein YprB with RNaseH-like and TPR domain
MIDPSDQLARLKARIAEVNRRLAAKYPKKVETAPRSPAVFKEQIGRWFIEEWSSGGVVKNEFGEHFQTERLFPAHKRHGAMLVGALGELPSDLLQAAGDGKIPAVPPGRWAFLDTETTGLLGAAGAHAFLIGVGRITEEGFRIRQFFVREYLEEGSVLEALAEHLANFNVLVTYNGKTFDQPLLESRYRAVHRASPFARLAHFDLLHAARRLWKLRIDDCRLMHLERRILGVEREGDLAGELVPYVYFEYLRSREAQRLTPIFHHNAIDILSLACLTAIVPVAFRTPNPVALAKAGLNRAEDLAGIARWLLAARRYEDALNMFRAALSAGLPDRLVFRTLWDVACLERKLGRSEPAQAALEEIISCENEYRAKALEELAKHCERSNKDYSAALRLIEEAIAYGASASLTRRKLRLENKLAKHKEAGPRSPSPASEE